MNLGEKVKKRRLELGMSQQELANKMGYSSRSTINKIEKGRPVSQKIIQRLSTALDISIIYLMGIEDLISEEDKEIIEEALSLRDKLSDGVEDMTTEELALKDFLNSMGYDLIKSHGNYSFIGKKSNGTISKENLDEMVTMVKNVLEPMAFKLDVELEHKVFKKINGD